MFDTQVDHFTKKFEETCKVVTQKQIDIEMRSVNFDEDKLYEGLVNNTKEFRTFVYNFCKQLMPGRVSCTTYAAVVAVICKRFEIPYSAYAGFCIPRSNMRYDAEMEAYNKKKATGVKHPVIATHVYLVANDINYEYYNGATDDIEHIDVVKMNV